jgi:hypothetical protein
VTEPCSKRPKRRREQTKDCNAYQLSRVSKLTSQDNAIRGAEAERFLTRIFAIERQIYLLAIFGFRAQKDS